VSAFTPSGYYLYKVSGGTEDGEFSYIGQAHSAQRVLSHLSSSSNRKLKPRPANATTWPSIQCMLLPEKCHGDLGIGESAFIAIERTLHGTECFNGRNEGGTKWFPGQGSSEYPDLLTRQSLDTDQLWSFEFCRESNKVAVRAGIDLLIHKKPLPTRFEFLPQGGQPIDRVSAVELHDRLDREGISSAFVVMINHEESDDRPPISPWTTNAQLAERCLKWWPTSMTRGQQVSENPPEALIAVLGDPAFRIVIGAWKLRSDGYDLETGECWPLTQDANFCDLQGSVLSPAVRFNQARHPILWARDRELTLVGC